jgi:hypothetical protein
MQRQISVCTLSFEIETSELIYREFSPAVRLGHTVSVEYNYRDGGADCV